MKKLKKNEKIFVFALLAVTLIALFDISSMLSGIFGTTEEYIAGNYSDGWWKLFFNVNITFLTFISLFYYSFVKDLSEAVSFLAASVILWFSGVADILFFWLQGQAVPEVLTHLNSHPVISRVASFIGYSQVTNGVLLVSAIVGTAVSFFTIKLLGEKL